MRLPLRPPSIDALRELPDIALNNLPSLKCKKKIRRRGNRGGKCGRGDSPNHKNKLGFQGGNTPFWRLIPKMRSPKPREGEFLRLNVGKLQVWIDRGKIDPSKKITLKTLQDSKLCSRTKYGVKLLGDGALGFVSKIDIEISAASKTAIEAVERNGGRIVAKYYSPLTLRALLKPEKFKVLPKEFPPTKNKLLDFYTNPEKNGYLSSKFI